MPRLGDRKNLVGAEFDLWLVLGDGPDKFEGDNRRGTGTRRRIRVLLCRCKGCGREAQVRYEAIQRGRSRGCENCRPGGQPSREEDWFDALDLYQKGLTYRQVGKRLGVCSNRARQMIEKARAYLREHR